MSYIFIHVGHNLHFYVYNLMISVGNLVISSDILSLFRPKCSTAVSNATGMPIGERSVDN